MFLFQLDLTKQCIENTSRNIFSKYLVSFLTFLTIVKKVRKKKGGKILMFAFWE